MNQSNDVDIVPLGCFFFAILFALVAGGIWSVHDHIANLEKAIREMKGEK